MAATRNSVCVYVAVDPIHDYEESLTILGVYGSLAAAKVAVRALRAQPDGFYRFQASRRTEVQEWVGDELRTTWTFDPASGWKKEADR